MAKPKVQGKSLPMSFQVSAPSSLRKRPQWFCRKRRSGGGGGVGARGGARADAVDALAELGGLAGHEDGGDALVAGPPGRAAVVGAVDAAGGDGDERAVGIFRVGDDGVEAETAAAGLPLLAVGVFVEAFDDLP